MNVSLSTDDPLQVSSFASFFHSATPAHAFAVQFHFTKEPLLEEYSCAAQIYKFSPAGEPSSSFVFASDDPALISSRGIQTCASSRATRSSSLAGRCRSSGTGSGTDGTFRASRGTTSTKYAFSLFRSVWATLMDGEEQTNVPNIRMEYRNATLLEELYAAFSLLSIRSHANERLRSALSSDDTISLPLRRSRSLLQSRARRSCLRTRPRVSRRRTSDL